MQVKGLESVNLFSENAKKLAEFYRDQVGLKITLDAEMGEKGEQVFGFEMGFGSDLFIMDHTKVKGKNKTPQRMFFNLEVDDIEKAAAALKKNRVKKIRDIYHVQEYGYISTFEDIDGNYFQLVKTRP